MAEDLDLFGQTKDAKNPKAQKARIYTAWAVFSWQAMFSYYMFRTPHLRRPPEIPLPDPTTHSKWYGEIWIQYPRSQTLIPLCLGNKMKCETILRIIMNEIALQSFGELNLIRPLPLSETIAYARKLDGWIRDLPDILAPKQVVLPPHLSLQ
jgi:hypothetical protein